VRPGALVASITRMGVPADLPARPLLPGLRMPELRPSGWDPWPVGARAQGGEPPLTLADVLRGV
jgi:hypothetical protein